MNAPPQLRVNLLPHRAAARRRRERLLLWWLAGGALAGLLLALLAGLGLSMRSTAHARQTQHWQQASAALAGAQAAARQVQREGSVLAARQQAVAQLQAQRNDWVLLLSALARAVPPGVTLHGLRQQGRQLRLEGRAPAQEQVAALLEALALALPQSRPALLEVRATPAAGVELTLQLQWPAACPPQAEAPC